MIMEIFSKECRKLSSTLNSKPHCLEKRYVNPRKGGPFVYFCFRVNHVTRKPFLIIIHYDN